MQPRRAFVETVTGFCSRPHPVRAVSRADTEEPKWGRPRKAARRLACNSKAARNSPAEWCDGAQKNLKLRRAVGTNATLVLLYSVHYRKTVSAFGRKTWYYLNVQTQRMSRSLLAPVSRSFAAFSVFMKRVNVRHALPELALIQVSISTALHAPSVTWPYYLRAQIPCLMPAPGRLVVVTGIWE